MNWILVDPAYRGKADPTLGTTIARYLNMQAETHFKSKNCVGMIAGILDNNAPSLRMHAAIGYTKDVTIPAREGIGWYTKNF